jgi:hypothetical protein
VPLISIDEEDVSERETTARAKSNGDFVEEFLNGGNDVNGTLLLAFALSFCINTNVFTENKMTVMHSLIIACWNRLEYISVHLH